MGESKDSVAVAMKTISPRPGDVILVTVDGFVSVHDADEIANIVKKSFPDNKIVVVEQDTLSIAMARQLGGSPLLSLIDCQHNVGVYASSETIGGHLVHTYRCTVCNAAREVTGEPA